MTDSKMKLPQESLSQEIGEMAKIALIANLPIKWRLTATDGDNDYGLDYVVQLVHDRHPKAVFHMQLKGSTQSKLSSDGAFYSVSLDVKTLNYYARIADPVILVLADLSKHLDNPKDAPVVWEWVSETARRLANGRDDLSHLEGESITIRIPSANKLKPDLDISPAIIEFSSRSAALLTLHDELLDGANSITATSFVRGLTTQIKNEGPSLLGAVMDPLDRPWLEPLTGENAETLKIVDRHLIGCADDTAERILRELHDSGSLEVGHETAEWEYLTARVHLLRGEDEEYEQHIERAHKYFPGSALYASAWYETQFRRALAQRAEHDCLIDLLAEIPESKGPYSAKIRAKILCELGQMDDAIAELDRLPVDEATVTRALISYLHGRWDEALEYSQTAINLQVGNVSELTIAYVLKADSYFSKAMNGAESDRGVIPPYGVPGIDFDNLRLAWAAAIDATKFLRRRNWPVQVAYLINVITVAGVSLRNTYEAFCIIEEIAEARPHLKTTYPNLHVLAVMCDEHDAALRAVEKFEDPQDRIHVKILTLYGAKRFEALLNYAESELLSADPAHHQHACCLAVSALSAEQRIETERGKPFLDALSENPEWRAEQSVYQCVSSMARSGLRDDSAVAELERAYNENPGLDFVQDNLLVRYQPSVREDAEKIVPLATEIMKRRCLSLSEVRGVAQALATSADWSNLVSFIDHHQQQFGTLPELLTFKAVALDQSGESARALSTLENAIEMGEGDAQVIRNYIEICVRCGKHDEAKRQLHTLLDKESDRAKKASILQQIFSLEYLTKSEIQRPLRIAIRYGDINDRESELEEGLFLQMFLMATLNTAVTVSEGEKSNFQQRAEKYFANFPNSSVISSVKFSQGEGDRSLLEQFNTALGITEEQQKYYRKIENQMNRGELPVPFGMRPRRFLQNVMNTPFLWEIGKNSSRDAHAYHLSLSHDPSYKILGLSRGLDRPPLLDLITLLLLHDLKLLHVLFVVFDRIAISKSTLIAIQNYANPLVYGYEPAVELKDFLKSRLESILQPSSPSLDRDSDEFVRDEDLVELKEIYGTGKYTLYSDDYFFRVYCGADENRDGWISTLDLLEEAERRDLLTVNQVSEKLALLTNWKVGIVVTGRHFFAALPMTLKTAGSFDYYKEEIDKSDAFRSLCAALWDIRLNYKNQIHHIASVLAYVARNLGASTELMAAIWKKWLEHMRFRTEPKDPEENHLVMSFVLAVHKCERNDSRSVRRLWAGYILLIESIFGDQMDKDKELDARRNVAILAAKIAREHETNETRGELFEQLRSGMEKGTQEYDVFSDAYAGARIAEEAEHKKH